MFQRKYGNSLPPDVDVLIDQRFLRKKYKDPITGGDFVFLGAGSPELAQALTTPPEQQGQGPGTQRGRGFGVGVGVGAAAQPPQTQSGRAQATPLGFGRGAGASSGFTPIQRGTTFMPGGRGAQTAAGQAANAQAGGGILAVASKSNQTSMRVYNGKSKYNEWIFMAVAATTAAGAPPGSGEQGPGGRGGRAGGRGGTPIGGRNMAPPPPRSRGGFSPIRP
jgi:hypothetical protein